MRFYWSIDLAGLFLIESLSCSVLLVDSFHLVDCSPQASPVHGILQARILEWLAIPFSGRSSWPWNRTSVSCIAESFFFFFYQEAAKEAPKFIHLAPLDLGCSTWDLVFWPGIEPGPPALGALSLSHWTTKEVSKRTCICKHTIELTALFLFKVIIWIYFEHSFAI